MTLGINRGVGIQQQRLHVKDLVQHLSALYSYYELLEEYRCGITPNKTPQNILKLITEKRSVPVRHI